MIDITNALLTSRRNRPYLRNPRQYTIYDLKGVIVHWTANTSRGANAWANRNYFNTTTRYASAHYMVDDNRILRCLPDNEVGYHVGARRYRAIGNHIMEDERNPNYFLIGIEMCVNEDGDWDKTYKNTVDLTIHLLNKYNFTIYQLWRHHDITGKDCPKMMIEEEPWQKFRRDVNAGVKLPVVEPVKHGRIVVDDFLNIRNGNGSQYDVVGKLMPGDEVNIYDRLGKWYRIGDNKWAHGNYIDVILKSKSGKVVLEGDRLNVRKGPGTRYEIIDKLENGTTVEVADSAGKWLRLKDDLSGNERWVHGNYIKLEEVRNGIVLSERLIIREGPGSNFSKVKRLTKGDVVRIFDEEDDWLKLGTDEWAHRNYIDIVA